ncbi:CHASE2 domain-containing protein [Synechococcus sp. PCC 7336]|uniref:CHASE2 domain-containing protein n=1 Tax=Synechococcus sp. PCC 7336 TaxID=195250 RepID=UPI00034D3941|nr:CHASE2 domain-containing protein [Synechococcus sp. PCC 7336]
MRTYQIGGSLDPEHPFYIERQADSDLYTSLLSGEFCFVFNARQMGKSSLMVRAMSRLQQEGIRSAAIDMSRIGGEGVTPEQWYKGVAIELWRSLGLVGTVDLLADWRAWGDLAPVQKWNLFVEGLLNSILPSTSRKTGTQLVVFVDEIDSLLSLSFPVDDFFASLRSYYNQRSLNANFQQLTFALLGAATPAELIGDDRATPFNIGRSIALHGFQWQEAQPLARGLEGSTRNAGEALREILVWTAGQPFLTQKLCQLVADRDRTQDDATRDDLEMVAGIVRAQVVKHWELQDVPEHLRTIRDRLIREPRRAGRLLGLYQQVLKSEQVGELLPFEGDRKGCELLLSGIVSNQQGYLRVKNPIYHLVFDRAWVERQLADLRPYAQLLSQWLDSNGDEIYLLQGTHLQDALDWSADRRLSDADHRYLAASRDLAQRQTQAALDALERGSQLLAESRQQARREGTQPAWGWSGAIALGIAVPVLLLRFAGLLQAWEWSTLDLLFRWQPAEPPDRRILVVTVDERDIDSIGQWPLTDGVLARAITRLDRYEPRAIGLDFYRNLPVEPGHEQLMEVFRTTPHLVGIEKVVGDRLAPADELSRLGQVGFADVMLDSDGKVRRALLSVQLAEEDIRQSFATRLALSYLMAEDTSATALEGSRKRLRLGRRIFERFERNDGGYVRAEAGGFQILLNFRGNAADFDTLPLRQVLEDRHDIPDSLVRDRVVLIGLTAQSASDWFLTPYSDRLSGFPEHMPGIVIHANILSQILSSALDGRVLLRVWSDPWEGLWILFWAAIGSGIAWQLRSLGTVALALMAIASGLVAGCFLAFLWGWWLPLVPALLACGAAAGVAAILAERQREWLLFHSTLTRLSEAQEEDPVAGRIALEYLRQSENPAAQAIVEQHLQAATDSIARPN